jgi:hypothetical protein
MHDRDPIPRCGSPLYEIELASSAAQHSATVTRALLFDRSLHRLQPSWRCRWMTRLWGGRLMVTLGLTAVAGKYLIAAGRFGVIAFGLWLSDMPGPDGSR